MKYCETGIVFREFPDEITLAINISNCPHRCIGCHSKHLQTDCGDILDEMALDKLLAGCSELITCVGFMGGDSEREELLNLCKYTRRRFPGLKIGLYSGDDSLPDNRLLELLDYVKIGPYIESLGPINSTGSNQKMYKKVSGEWKEMKLK